MTTRTVYIADDGEEFETEEECAAHERCMKTLPGTLGFDDAAVFQNPADSNADEAFSRSEYIFIVDEEEAAKTFEYFGSEYGYTVPATTYHTGDILRYDYDKDVWVNMVKEYVEHTEMMIGLLNSIGDTLPDEQLHVAAVTLKKLREAVSGLM